MSILEPGVSVAAHYLQVGNLRVAYPLLTPRPEGGYELSRFEREQARTIFVNGMITLEAPDLPLASESPQAISISELSPLIASRSDWVLHLPKV